MRWFVIAVAVCGCSFAGGSAGDGGDGDGSGTGTGTGGGGQTSTTDPSGGATSTTTTGGGTNTGSSTGETGGNCVEHSWYPDLDRDGFGGSGGSITACTPPQGFTDNGDDCDDQAAGVNPDAVELCDDIDNDCDGGIDEGSAQNLDCRGCAFTVVPGEPTMAAHCSQNAPWLDARDRCLEMGGDLVVITTPAQNDFIAGLGSGDRWIGLNDRMTEGHWVWVDGSDAIVGGTPVGFQNWRGNEPDDFLFGEDCGQLVASDGGWGDAGCDSSRRFVCEHPL